MSQNISKTAESPIAQRDDQWRRSLIDGIVAAAIKARGGAPFGPLRCQAAISGSDVRRATNTAPYSAAQATGSNLRQ